MYSNILIFICHDCVPRGKQPLEGVNIRHGSIVQVARVGVYSTGGTSLSTDVYWWKSKPTAATKFEMLLSAPRSQSEEQVLSVHLQLILWISTENLYMCMSYNLKPDTHLIVNIIHYFISRKVIWSISNMTRFFSPIAIKSMDTNWALFPDKS